MTRRTRSAVSEPSVPVQPSDVDSGKLVEAEDNGRVTLRDEQCVDLRMDTRVCDLFADPLVRFVLPGVCPSLVVSVSTDPSCTVHYRCANLDSPERGLSTLGQGAGDALAVVIGYHDCDH